MSLAHRAVLVVLLVVASRGLFAAADAPRYAAVYFDDSRGDVLLLGNDVYEVAFRKSNGSIAYVTDKSTGQHVTNGSADQCLWAVRARGSASPLIGASSYGAAAASRFTYAWTPATNTLRLIYDPDALDARRVSAEVLVTGSPGPWFDMRLHLENHTGAALQYVSFPSDLAFVEDDIQEALLPVLPGVVLERSFFAQHRTFTARYPGSPGLFADYVAVSTNKGRLALYSVHDAAPFRPTVIGFAHDDARAGGTLMRHAFGVDIANGQAWESPAVRVRISEPFLDTVNGYRVDNGLDKIASLRQKLGARYEQVVQSPLYKADAVGLRVPFSEYGSMFSSLPSPGILHLVGFQPGGHDHSYPDFLPPAQEFGTTSQFVAMCQEAQAAGLLVMPYTNPTWWNDTSATLQQLPDELHIEDVAADDEGGRPRHETYGPNFGYLVSPFAPFVQQRLDLLVRAMTETVPSDLLFEDQIGARPWLFDYNVHSPDASAYVDGWLQHTRTYKGRLLMTELGFDRLAETEVAFAGSVLLTERIGEAQALWGAGTWHVFPVAPMMARDKALFYQHDLAGQTMTSDTTTLTWNLAFGFMLGYDVSGDRTNPFLALAAAIQKHVLALYASERITNFEHIGAKVTRTRFESFTVTANWDDSTSFSEKGYTLPPAGVMTRSDDGTATAGVFWVFNSVPLSPGNHYLIERRDASGISVYQPIGPDTSLTVKLPPGWNAADAIVGVAYDTAGEVVGRVPLSATADGITFRWVRHPRPAAQAAGRPLPRQVVGPGSRPVPARGEHAAGNAAERAGGDGVHVVRIERAAVARPR